MREGIAPGPRLAMKPTATRPAGDRPARGRGPPTLSKALFRPLAVTVLAVAVCTPLVFVAVAHAAELVMFESPTCEWCEAWDRDVGVVYHKTEEGRLAPLRRVTLGAPRPQDLRAIDAVVYTPTFVLVDRGRELGRITGYPGENHFWGLLGVLLEHVRAGPGT